MATANRAVDAAVTVVCLPAAAVVTRSGRASAAVAAVAGLLLLTIRSATAAAVVQGAGAGTVAAATIHGGSVLSASLRAGDSGLNAQGLPLLTPTSYVERGRAVYWERPAGKVLGTLALFHGCAHDASDFWPRANCPECDGLPEEVAHTKQALARGYAVVALDAANATSRCFSIHADLSDVLAVLTSWLQGQGLQEKPLYLLGVSAGAAFALKLPVFMDAPRPAGVISEVLGILPDGWNADWLKGAYPPTAFISMPRDAKTAARIAANVALLASFGVPSSVLEVHPQPLADDFLSKRSELISPEVSAQVVAVLKAVGLVDNETNAIVEDPRYSRKPWRAALRAGVPQLVAAANDSLTADASAVSEELNRAYANHESVGDHLTACLAWLEARGTLPLPGLAAQFAAVALPSERLRDLQPQRLRMLPMRARRMGSAAPAPAEQRR